MYLRLFAFVCCLSLFAIGCKPVEEIIKDPEENGVFSAKVDGETFSVGGIQVTAEYNDINQMVTSMAIGAVKLPLGGINEAIALAIVSADSSGINIGDVFTATNSLKVAAGEYVYEDDNGIDIKAVSENPGIATITITDLDLSKMIVSGTFSFEGSDDDDLTKIYKITDGVFKDIPIR